MDGPCCCKSRQVLSWCYHPIWYVYQPLISNNGQECWPGCLGPITSDQVRCKPNIIAGNPTLGQLTSLQGWGDSYRCMSSSPRTCKSDMTVTRPIAQTLLHGYLGLRTSVGEMNFHPRVPTRSNQPTIERLSIPIVQWTIDANGSTQGFPPGQTNQPKLHQYLGLKSLLGKVPLNPNPTREFPPDQTNQNFPRSKAIFSHFTRDPKFTIFFIEKQCGRNEVPLESFHQVKPTKATAARV